MNVIDEMIKTRTNKLLEFIEEMSIEIVEETIRNQNSTKVQDLAKVGELPEKIMKKMAEIHIELALLKTLSGE